MARTRTQIKTAIDNNTGRGTEKATLIETLADEALKVAVEAHSFRDARSIPADFTITEDATSVSISSISNLVTVVTARIVEADGSLNRPLPLKDEIWWAKKVINAEDNSKGWPSVGMRRGTDIQLNRPANSGLELRLIVSTEQTFANDAAVCPIKILDTFVIQYITAFVFLSIEATEKFAYWKHLALGWKWDEGIVGGSLKHAIDNDSADIAEESAMEGPGVSGLTGMSIQNLITGHDDYGNTRAWFDNYWF
ncbi:hypothetical protein LCGC14_2791320 [marine sediment metagenome]|uniref:Uncharacterized protein n=1 Tax=marine sediment metagenome TaxID=412755 RepID=A0A0F8YQD5_9ZZZZ